MKPNLLMLSALLCVGAASPASAQQVYKCWSKGSVVYSERRCSNRVVSTDQAPVPVKPNPKEVDLQRLEQNRVMARSSASQRGRNRRAVRNAPPQGPLAGGGPRRMRQDRYAHAGGGGQHEQSRQGRSPKSRSGAGSQQEAVRRVGVLIRSRRSSCDKGQLRFAALESQLGRYQRRMADGPHVAHAVEPHDFGMGALAGNEVNHLARRQR